MQEPTGILNPKGGGTDGRMAWMGTSRAWQRVQPAPTPVRLALPSGDAPFPERGHLAVIGKREESGAREWVPWERWQWGRSRP